MNSILKMTDLPVDKDWAWMVALGAFITNFLTLGIYSLYGVIFVEVGEYFNSSSTITSLMFTVSTLLGIVSSMVYGAVGNRFASRSYSLFGTALITSAFVLPQLTPNIYAFIFMFGATVGTGTMITQLACMSILTVYFKERLTIASGLASMGSSCGQLVLPQLMNFLQREYNTMGALLILGGCNLNILVAAMLFRPVTFYEKSNNKTSSLQKDIDSVSDVMMISFKSEHVGGITNVAYSENSGDVGLSGTEQSERPSVATSDNIRQLHVSCLKEATSNGTKHSTPPSEHSINNSQAKYEIDARNSRKPTGAFGLRQRCRLLCTSASFKVFNLGRLLSLLLFSLMLTYFPPYIIALGYSSSEVALFLTIIGALDLPSKPLHGWITSLKCVDATIYTGITTLTGSAIIMFAVVFPSFFSLVAMCVAVGVFVSPISCLLVVVLTDLVGRSLLHISMPFVIVPTQFFTLFIPVVFGMLYDARGSYRVPMMIVAGFGLAGGTITIIEKWTRKKSLAT